MGGGGLLIFYVTNVACYKSELKVSYSRRGRTRQSPIIRDASIGMYHLRTRTKCILSYFETHFVLF